MEVAFAEEAKKITFHLRILSAVLPWPVSIIDSVNMPSFQLRLKMSKRLYVGYARMPRNIVSIPTALGLGGNLPVVTWLPCWV